MIVDTTSISTFGLSLSYLSDYYNLPSRKKTLNVTGSSQKDIVFEANEATIVLVGNYSSKADLGAKIEAFKALIKSNPIHEYTLLGHNVTFSGSVREGIKVDVIKTLAKLTFKVTIIE